IDRFPIDLVRYYFTATGGDSGTGVGGALLPEVPLDRVLALGAEDNPGMFNMAHMGLRLAQRANGVSRLHGEVSREMFGDLWPGFETSEVPIGHVTNGVHAPTWVARDIMEIAEREVDLTTVDDVGAWQQQIGRVP